MTERPRWRMRLPAGSRRRAEEGPVAGKYAFDSKGACFGPTIVMRLAKDVLQRQGDGKGRGPGYPEWAQAVTGL